jgi:hypothetical protein
MGETVEPESGLFRVTLSAQGKTPAMDLYRLLERFGVSPASEYKLSIMKIRTSPVIDGESADQGWLMAETDLRFIEDDFTSDGPNSTRVKAGYDIGHLYLLKDSPSLSTSDGDVEYIVIGFDTNHNGGIDYTFEIDKNSQVFGQKDSVTCWDSEINAHIGLTTDGWILEVAIPFSALEWDKEIENNTWGFNLSHGVRGQNTRLRSWPPTLGQPSNAQRYGDLVFQ